MLENVKKATALLEEREEEMKTIKEEHERLKDTIASMQKTEVDLEQAYEDASKALKENQVCVCVCVCVCTVFV